MRWNQDWLRGTRSMSGKIVIVNDCCDDNLIERVKKEIDTTLNYPALKDGDSCFTEDSFTHRSYD